MKKMLMIMITVVCFGCADPGPVKLIEVKVVKRHRFGDTLAPDGSGKLHEQFNYVIYERTDTRERIAKSGAGRGEVGEVFMLREKYLYQR